MEDRPSIGGGEVQSAPNPRMGRFGAASIRADRPVFVRRTRWSPPKVNENEAVRLGPTKAAVARHPGRQPRRPNRLSAGPRPGPSTGPRPARINRPANRAAELNPRPGRLPERSVAGRMHPFRPNLLPVLLDACVFAGRIAAPPSVQAARSSHRRPCRTPSVSFAATRVRHQRGNFFRRAREPTGLCLAPTSPAVPPTPAACRAPVRAQTVRPGRTLVRPRGRPSRVRGRERAVPRPRGGVCRFLSSFGGRANRPGASPRACCTYTPARLGRPVAGPPGPSRLRAPTSRPRALAGLLARLGPSSVMRRWPFGDGRRSTRGSRREQPVGAGPRRARARSAFLASTTPHGAGECLPPRKKRGAFLEVGRCFRSPSRPPMAGQPCPALEAAVAYRPPNASVHLLPRTSMPTSRPALNALPLFSASTPGLCRRFSN